MGDNLALDQVLIGNRIREIREDLLQETRASFAKRCGLKERYISQLERGEVLINVIALNQIATFTGTSTDYILYGKVIRKRLQVVTNLHHIIDTTELEELQLFYRSICDLRSYMYKKIG